MAQCKHQGLCPLGFGFSLGIVWGIVLFVMGMVAALSRLYGVDFVKGLSTIYIGYAPSFVGALLGLFWGFLDAFVAGVIFVWLYNFFCLVVCGHGKGNS